MLPGPAFTYARSRSITSRFRTPVAATELRVALSRSGDRRRIQGSPPPNLASPCRSTCPRVATSSAMALVPPTEEMARLWREQVFLECRWTVCANQSGVLGYVADGEAGGRFVVADRWPERRAYMKPRRRDPDPRRVRAAREKICADLAHEVGCRVPPVVLARRQGDPPDEEHACCVSLVMYPRQYPWEQIK